MAVGGAYKYGDGTDWCDLASVIGIPRCWKSMETLEEGESQVGIGGGEETLL